MRCGEYFVDDRGLQIHREKAHASPEKTVNGFLGCTECGRAFQWERDLQRHQRLHGSQVDDPLEADKEKLQREDEEDDDVKKRAISTNLKQSNSLVQDTNADNPYGDEYTACLTMDKDWTGDLVNKRDAVQEELEEEEEEEEEKIENEEYDDTAAFDPYADHFAAFLRLDNVIQ